VAECVDASPPPRNVEQLEMVDPDRQRGVDDEVLAEWLEAEHRPEEEERRAGRPRLRAARGRILPSASRR
jgi:hypothetical protein